MDTQTMRASIETAPARDASALTSLAGAVRDLGGLIDIAALEVGSLNNIPSVRTIDFAPAIAGVRTTLNHAGVLVKRIIRQASRRAAVEGLVDVDACMSELAAALRSSWGERFRLALRIGGGLTPVKCDGAGLQGAVLNLLLNARDAMPDGGTISISVAETSGDPLEGVAICVEDEGVGMTPATIQRAFDPFFTTKTDGLGGFGLPMVERFAHAAGGRAQIESTFGLGTRVTLFLPSRAGGARRASAL